MKIVIKACFALITLILLSISTQAQTNTGTQAGTRLNIGIGAGLPVGNYKNFLNYELGASIQLELPIAQKLFFTANTGYQIYHGDTKPGNYFSTPNYNMIPLKPGLKYFAFGNVYIQGEAGVTFITNVADIKYSGVSATNLITDAQIGVLLPVGVKHNIDAGFAYTSFPFFTSRALNAVALRVAYSFGL